MVCVSVKKFHQQWHEAIPPSFFCDQWHRFLVDLRSLVLWREAVWEAGGHGRVILDHLPAELALAITCASPGCGSRVIIFRFDSSSLKSRECSANYSSTEGWFRTWVGVAVCHHGRYSPLVEHLLLSPSLPLPSLDAPVLPYNPKWWTHVLGSLKKPPWKLGEK